MIFEDLESTLKMEMVEAILEQLNKGFVNKILMWLYYKKYKANCPLSNY